jgi:hypothetical protein
MYTGEGFNLMDFGALDLMGLNKDEINFGYNPNSGNWEFSSPAQVPIPEPSAPTTASAPPSPTPPVSPWSYTATYRQPSGIKQAEPDIVLQGDDVESPELMTQILFEEMGGVELISMSRSDVIDGVPVSYSPIANLSALRNRFNPNNIIASSSRDSDHRRGYGIDMDSRGAHIPYLDADGNLVIEVDIIGTTEIIELDIAINGTMSRVTI